MTEKNQNRLVWALACLAAAFTFIVYWAAGRAPAGVTLMPLDDVYIHFQYARGIAEGYPYRYNPGLPPTSGATSLLYPYMLAAGYALGFRDLTLGTWAMIVGAVAFAVSIYLVYRIGRLRAPFTAALLIALAFAAGGAFAWHAMSGMETMLAVVFSLLLLYGFALRAAQHAGWRAVVLAGGTLLALTRPEGAVGAVLAALVLGYSVLSARYSVLSTRYSASRTRNPEPSRPNPEPNTQNPELSTERRAPSTEHRVPRLWRFAWLLPLLAIGAQPLINLLVTGSATASGSAAKSLLNALAPREEIIRRILDNAARMAREWLLPSGEPVYSHALISALAVGAALYLLLASLYSFLRRSRAAQAASAPSAQFQTPPSEYRVPSAEHPAPSTPAFALVVLLVIVWLLGSIALISTLDTAFWHFRRYQIPAMALLFPLAAWGLGLLSSRYLVLGTQYSVLRNANPEPSTEYPGASTPNSEPSTQYRVPSTILALAVGALAVGLCARTWPGWVRHYGLNVGYVAAQPYPMAAWLRENAAPDAVVAVHDVGMMRYYGGRTTLDIVGLTTPGAAASWRQGPGAVGEFLAAQRPDLIASYGIGHGLGLGFLAATDLYAEPLATFPVTLDPTYNVALAADVQGIYRPDWRSADAAAGWHQEQLSAALAGLTEVDALNVGDLADEAAHGYVWTNTRPGAGFPTEFNQFPTLDCREGCALMDGGRRVNGEESFTLQARPGLPAVLVTRVHAGHAGEFEVYANDQLVGRRALPFLPGSWLEIAIFIPADVITSEALHIRIAARLGEGDYMPYRHWLLQGGWTTAPSPDPLAVYQQGAFTLERAALTLRGTTLEVAFAWATDGSARGDWVAFAHVYPEGDEALVVAQTDRRPGNGTLPPGNWLPGVIEDTFVVDLAGIPPGRYTVGIGFYAPDTFERLAPTLTDAAPEEYRLLADGRLFIGTVTVAG